MVIRSGSCVYFLLLLSFFLTLFTSAKAETIQNEAGTYHLYRPKGTDSAPAIVFLHGQGGNESQGRNVFESYAANRGYVLIAPRGTSQAQSWNLDRGRRVRQIVEKVISEGGVDKSRILLVGYSAGGSAAYNFGTNCSDLYAAMACVNCYMAPGSANLQGKLPVLILECEKDPNFPAAQQAEATLKEAGFSTTFQTIPGYGHAYPTSTASPKILDWFEKTVKGDNGSPSEEPSQSDDDDDDDNENDSGNSNEGEEGSSEGGNTSSDDENNSENERDSDADELSTPEETNTNVGENQPAEEPTVKPEPVVNTYGLSIGGLTDGEIESLVTEWLNTVWRPKQSPPASGSGWRLDEWGVWVSGAIQHIGGIDGYRSPADYWIKNNAECRAYVEKLGSEKYPEAGAGEKPGNAGQTAGEKDGATTVAANRPGEKTSGQNGEVTVADSEGNSSSGGSGDGSTSSATDSSTEAASSEAIPDLGGPSTTQSGSVDSVNGRAIDLYVPSSFSQDESKDWGLVICLAGVAGNTGYLKEKMRAGCDANKCIFAGLKAKNSSGSPFGFRWENDQDENAKFIEDVVARIEGHYGLSSARTYLFGFSNGAGFISLIGSRVDNTMEGYVSCEGGSFFGSSDKQVVISGSRDIGCSQNGNRWSAYCPGMGHKFPGKKLAMYQDPGVEQTKDGKKINGEELLSWLDS
mgnify:CR=1 FL=1